MIKNILRTFTLATAVTLTASLSHAAVLTPGGSTFVPGTTVLENPALAAVVLNDDILTTPFLRIPDPASIFFVGFDIQNRVTQSSVDGSLIFGPRIRFGANVTSGNFFIDRLQLSGYGDFETDVAFRTDGLGDVGPTFAERSADGDTLTFDYGFPIVVGNLVESTVQESFFLSIVTNGTSFENTGRATIFGRHIDFPGQVFRLDFAGLAVPTTAVPLPAAFLMMLSGLAACGWRMKKQA